MTMDKFGTQDMTSRNDRASVARSCHEGNQSQNLGMGLTTMQILANRLISSARALATRRRGKKNILANSMSEE